MKRLEDERPEPPSVLPGRRKSTRRWCKGRDGVEHVTEVTVDVRRAYGQEAVCKPWGDNAGAWGHNHWRCFHVTRCVTCGKIIEHWMLCPDMPSGFLRWP